MACRLAIDVGDPTYRTVKGILAAGTETTVAAEPAANTGPAHLHGSDRLFAVEDININININNDDDEDVDGREVAS